jgi:hypothetical protein
MGNDCDLESSGDGDGRAAARSFSLARDRSALEAAHAAAESLKANLYDNAGVSVERDSVRVWLGEPPTFAITIPRSSIRSAEAVPDLPPGSSLGAHGLRWRWLVDSAPIPGSSDSASTPPCEHNFVPRWRYRAGLEWACLCCYDRSSATAIRRCEN